MRIVILVFVMLVPGLARGGAINLAVLPWNVFSQKEMDFLREALVDMLSSRLGTDSKVKIQRFDLIDEVLRTDGGRITDRIARETGEKLKVDYVLYGSITFMGDFVSIDAKLLSTGNGTIEAFYASGKGIDSVVDLADTIASDILEFLAEGAQ